MRLVLVVWHAFPPRAILTQFPLLLPYLLYLPCLFRGLIVVFCRYQLHGPPQLTPVSQVRSKNLSPKILRETRTHTQDTVLMDRSGSLIRVFDGA